MHVDRESSRYYCTLGNKGLVHCLFKMDSVLRYNCIVNLSLASVSMSTYRFYSPLQRHSKHLFKRYFAKYP